MVHSSQAYLQGQSSTGRWAQGHAAGGWRAGRGAALGVTSGAARVWRAQHATHRPGPCWQAGSGQQHLGSGSGGGGGGSGAHLVSGRQAAAAAAAQACSMGGCKQGFLWDPSPLSAPTCLPGTDCRSPAQRCLVLPQLQAATKKDKENPEKIQTRHQRVTKKEPSSTNTFIQAKSNIQRPKQLIRNIQASMSCSKYWVVVFLPFGCRVGIC